MGLAGEQDRRSMSDKRRLLSHLEKLRKLRAEVDKGIRSLDQGTPRLEEFLRGKSERYGGE